MEKRYIVMTGATSGLGLVAARKMLEEGANLIILARDLNKIDELNKGVSKNIKGSIRPFECDLLDFESLRSAVNWILSEKFPIYMLINNAGMWPFEPGKSKNGVDQTFQANVLAHIFLMQQLGPILAQFPDHKIINTASALHQGKINFEDIEYKNNFNGFFIYRQSKLALILLSRLYAAKTGQHVYLMHPGLVNTGLARGGNAFTRLFFRYFGMSPEKGAASLLYLFRTPVDQLVPGAYYQKSALSRTSTAYSNDLDVAEQLNKVIETYMQRLIAQT